MRNNLISGTLKTGMFLCILLEIMCMKQANAQNERKPADLSVFIVDQDGAPITAGNAYLLDFADSTFVVGASFLHGTCLLETNASGLFLLKIQSLGFQPGYMPVKLSDADTFKDLGEFSLKTMELDEVVIQAQENIFEDSGDGFIFKVAKSSYRNMGTALDLLRSTPKVLTNSTGQVQVMGKGTTNIYLDGQLITSPQLLSNLSSTDVIRIEVIENPGAQYDASANAVINIITNKKRLQGYEIDLVQEVGQGKFFRSYYQAKGYARHNKLSIQLGYGLRPWSWGGRNNQFRNHSFQGEAYHIGSRFTHKNERVDHDIQLKGSISLSPKSDISFQYLGIAIDGERSGTNIREAFVNEMPSLSIDSRL
ncbi:MAG: hypothetical protein AAF388_12995, partial [Bacteroidota bacterium]